MTEAFHWWLAVEGAGLIGLPIAFVLLRRLPDAGYAFTKPLGLLLGAYLFWLALSLHVLPNRPGSIVWVFLLLGAIDVYLVRRMWREMLEAFEKRAGVVIAVEVLFALSFAVAVYLRAFVPEISGTEKPMDFMLLNAASRDRFYPPADPWFAGASVSYYYFGYVIQAMLAKVAVVSTATGFNLALASTAALAATAAFGLAYNLVGLARNVAFRTALAGGLLAALFVVVLGNLEGVLEFMVANGWDPVSLAKFSDIANLDSAQLSTACVADVLGKCFAYPSDQSSYWWWWRATRISPDAGSITEFPFFSFLLGDLHPHVMSIPYVLTAVALGLAFWRSETRLAIDTWRRTPVLLPVAGVIVGGLGFLNTWDLPSFGFVVGALVVARNLVRRDNETSDRQTSGRAGERIAAALLASAGFLVPLFVVAVVAYAPFYLSFESQASGLASVQGRATEPLHSALLWAPLVLVALALPLVYLSLAKEATRRVGFALAVPLALLGFWALLTAATDGVGAIGDAMTARGWTWLTLLFFGWALAVALAALWAAVNAGAERGPIEENERVERTELKLRSYEERGDEERDNEAWAGERGLVPALVLIATALLLIYGSELFYIQDVFGTRLNTVFKLSYQGWLMLAVGAAFSAYWLGQHWLPAQASTESVLRGAWRVAAAVVVVGALLYPLGATLARTRGLEGTGRTLDGLAFVDRGTPEDRATARWLRDRAGLSERIVEATGNQYSTAGRLAVFSGVPSVVGWAGHELQWGRDPTEINQRVVDVDRAYSTDSLDEAIAILRKYDVTYIAVGGQERAKYPAAGLQKFVSVLPTAFRSGETTLYRVPLPEIDNIVEGQ